jgi:hypothetical protein
MRADVGRIRVTKIQTLSDVQLRERRETILRKLDVSLDDLRERAKSYALVGEEHEAWEQLESIAFLLGETRA